MLAGRYRLEERLAAGGMGAVYVAVDERLGRRVAVKLLKDELGNEADFVERFKREARAAAGLNHPNIAQVYDYGCDGEQHFIAMELVEGTDLARLLRERGRLSPPEAVGIATGVCAALAAAHAGGIVHRDIKPGNVIVGPDGHVKMTDFGIARAMGQSSLTHTGTVLGTAQYLSPEQARGEPAGPASDLYSLGVVLFQMLTGSVPFTADSPVAVALRHLHETVARPSEATPDVPAGLDDVVTRATAQDPSQRFVDADEMAAALQQALHVPTSVLPQSSTATTSALPATSHRTRRLLAWVGAAVLVTAVAVAVAMALGVEETSPPQAAPDAPGAPSSSPATHTDEPTAQPRNTRSPSASRRQRSQPPSAAPSGPVVPDGLAGKDGKSVEDFFKAGGYDVKKADIESAAPKDSVVDTIPAQGRPLTTGQTVILLVSEGEPADDESAFRVPSDMIGADAHDVEDRLGDQGVHVTKISVDSNAEKDTVLGTYPSAGTRLAGAEVILQVSSGHPPH